MLDSADLMVLDNRKTESSVVPLSRTYDFLLLEGSPTELAPGFQLNHAKSSPSVTILA